MILNLNIMYPEIFLSLSIFTILMIGVFIKDSLNIIFNLTTLICHYDSYNFEQP